MNNLLTILLIDDDADDIGLFLDAINEIDASIQCITALDGKKAIELLSQSANPKPDLIFLDLNMPRLDGKECLVELKKNKIIADVPVVIYSTSKLREDIQKTKELGAVAFFSKPTKFYQLITVVRDMLNAYCHNFHGTDIG